jgi:hypothetical protein
MTIFRNQTTPIIAPAAAEIAELLTHDILSEATGQPDVLGTEAIQALAPAIILGRTAMYLTQIPNTIEATRALFSDPELQERLLADLARTHEQDQVFTEKQLERIHALRESAQTGGIPIQKLGKGEIVVLHYVPIDGQNEPAYLKVKRNQEGGTPDRHTLLILDTDGPILDNASHTTNLITGDSVYLGYTPDGGKNHEPILEQGAPPAWGWSVEKKGKNYHIDGVYTEPTYTLHQIYYGETDQAPLFQ